MGALRFTGLNALVQSRSADSIEKWFYFIASDAASAFPTLSRIHTFGESVTLLHTKGVPLHSGRDVGNKSLLNSSEVTYGYMKVLVDFFMFDHVDKFISNCRDSHIHLARHMATECSNSFAHNIMMRRRRIDSGTNLLDS